MKLYTRSSFGNDFADCITEHIPCTENSMTEENLLWVMMIDADLQVRICEEEKARDTIYSMSLIRWMR